MDTELFNRLKSESLDERHSAVDEIVKIAENNVEAEVPVIISELKKSDNDKKWYLGRALIKVGKSVIPLIISESLNESDMEIQKYYGAILASFGEDAVEPLVNLFACDNPTSRGMAAAALEKIGDPAVLALMEAVQSDNNNVRLCSGFVLVRLGVYDY